MAVYASASGFSRAASPAAVSKTTKWEGFAGAFTFIVDTESS